MLGKAKKWCQRKEIWLAVLRKMEEEMEGEKNEWRVSFRTMLREWR